MSSMPNMSTHIFHVWLSGVSAAAATFLAFLSIKVPSYYSSVPLAPTGRVTRVGLATTGGVAGVSLATAGGVAGVGLGVVIIQGGKLVEG